MTAGFPQRALDARVRRVRGRQLVSRGSQPAVFELNEVATLIWDLCDGRTAPEAIASRICEEYGVEPGVAQGDVDELLAELGREGLITFEGDGR